jgi:hypothetical protein
MGPARKKEDRAIGALKRWRALGGSGGGGEQFYKFTDLGQVLEGIWRGTQKGKYGDNGVVETEDGVRRVFTLSAMLKDLVDVDDGTEVQITYLGMAKSKAGNDFHKFQILVEDNGEETPF